MLVGRKPPGRPSHHQRLPKDPQGEQPRTNRQNKETAGHRCNQTILLEGTREGTDRRACWAGRRGTQAKPQRARRQTHYRIGVPNPNRGPLSPFRKGRRGALQGCRQGTALRVPGRRIRPTGGGVPKRPRWSRPAGPTGHGSEQGVGDRRRLNPPGRRIQPLLLLLPASQLPPTGWSAFATPIKKSEQPLRQYSAGCYKARQRW